MRHILPLLFVAALTTALPTEAAGQLSINIYAIPSSPIIDVVAEASSELAARRMTTFHARGYPAHVTLYLTQYPATAVPQVKAAVAKVAKRCRSFSMTVNGLERTASNWLFLRVDLTPALQRLSDEITLATEPFRSHGLAAPAWMKEYPAKLPAFKRYGSPNVFMEFDPHLTLLAKETSPELAAYLADRASRPPYAAGQVTGIGIGVVDANGQVVKTLAEYGCNR